MYQVTRKPPSVPAVLLRRNTSRDAEPLVPRHENAVPRRQWKGPVRSAPAHRFRCAVLSALLPRRPLAPGLPVTPARSWPGTAGAAPPRETTAGGAREPDGRRPGRRSKSSPRVRRGRTPGGGHWKIQGEPARLGHPIAAWTVWEILHAAGVDPTPRRSGLTWRDFLTAQANSIVAADFFPLDTVLGKRLYAMAFLEHGTRRLHVTGATAHPAAVWGGAAGPQHRRQPR
ncbi:hypothetical protein WJ438_37360 [Streptomyces sp. GD-15H]|uniref:hypothetical protein n=1 Tax=Streptomyces sp. GD-15H TaxID=3129112 RepID=UPI003249F30D